MTEESTMQPDYTTVQLRRDLHKSVRMLAVHRDTDVKTEIEAAVRQYLAEQAQEKTAAVPQ